MVRLSFVATLPGERPKFSPGCCHRIAVESRTAWQGLWHDDKGHQRGESRPDRLRASDRSGQPVRGRTVGAVLVLRDAHDPGLLPLLLGHRGGPGHVPDHRDGDRRRVRRTGLLVDGARRVGRRPTTGDGTHRVLRRCGRDVGAHLVGAAAGAERCRCRPGAHRIGVGCAQGQRVVASGHPLRKERSPRGRWIHTVLPRHQPRCVHRSAAHRPTADPPRLPLRFRRRRGRDGAWPGAVRGVPPKPWRARARCPEPVAAQRDSQDRRDPGCGAGGHRGRHRARSS